MIARLLLINNGLHHVYTPECWLKPDIQIFSPPERLCLEDFTERIILRKLSWSSCLLRLRVNEILLFPRGNDLLVKTFWQTRKRIFEEDKTRQEKRAKTKGAKSGVYTKELQTNYRWIESSHYKCPWIQCHGTWLNNSPERNTIQDEPTFNYEADNVYFLRSQIIDRTNESSDFVYSAFLSRGSGCFRDSDLILNKQ